MNSQKDYSQKIKAEIELAQGKLAEFKTQQRSLTVEDRIQHIRRIEELERRIVDVRAKWNELEGARDDHMWRQMRGYVENIWKVLQDEIHETITDVQSWTGGRRTGRASTNFFDCPLKNVYPWRLPVWRHSGQRIIDQNL